MLKNSLRQVKVNLQKRNSLPLHHSEIRMYVVNFNLLLLGSMKIKYKSFVGHHSYCNLQMQYFEGIFEKGLSCLTDYLRSKRIFLHFSGDSVFAHNQHSFFFTFTNFFFICLCYFGKDMAKETFELFCLVIESFSKLSYGEVI